MRGGKRGFVVMMRSLRFVLCALVLLVACASGWARSAFDEITFAELPPQAQQTLALIVQGGPFPYPRKDGSTFGNREGRLPMQRRGYYREYTVPTPGQSTRGARRIIAGATGEYYYTADHYRSFRRITAIPARFP